MKSGSYLWRLLSVSIAIGLLGALACGSEEEAAPAPVPTPTVVVVPPLIIPTPVVEAAVPTPVPHGVTAVPRPFQKAQGLLAPTATSAPTGPQPVYGGTVSIGTAGIGTTGQDPASGQAGYGWPGGLGYSGNLWPQIIRTSLKDRVTVEGDLAESWSVSKDGTTYTFKWRDGVVDHDGNPLTAEDGAYQMYRYIERPNGLSAKRQGCFRAYIKDIEDDDGNVLAEPGIEATSPSELVIRLKAPRSAFLACLVTAWTIITPDTYTKAIDDSGEYRDLDFTKGELAGAGPFKVVQQEADNLTKFEKHDNFFRDGLPYLDGYTVFSIPDANTRVAAFLSGQVDYLGLFGDAPSPLDAERIVDQLGEDAVGTPRVNANGWRGFPLNVQKAPFGPVGDPDADKLRWALQIAEDRNEFNQLVMNGIGHLATPYFIGWNWLHTPEEWNDQYQGLDSTPAVKNADKDEARGIMESLGYSESNPLVVDFVCAIGNRNDCEVYDQQLEEIYVQADLTLAPDYASADAAGKSGDFQIIQVSKGLSFQDPDGYNVSTYLTWEEGGRNYSGHVNDEWRALMEEQFLINEQEPRAVVLRKMARIFWDEATMIGTVRPGVIGLYRKTMQGWTPPITHTNNYSLEEVWLEK